MDHNQECPFKKENKELEKRIAIQDKVIQELRGKITVLIEKEKKMGKHKQIDEETIKLAKKEKPKLHLEALGCLVIRYKGNQIGMICEDGKAHILTTYDKIKAYEEWREDGMLVDGTPILWRGRIYQITSIHPIILQSKGSYGDRSCHIYDFEECNPMINQDPNIIRHKHNNRTIIF